MARTGFGIFAILAGALAIAGPAAALHGILEGAGVDVSSDGSTVVVVIAPADAEVAVAPERESSPSTGADAREDGSATHVELAGVIRAELADDGLSMKLDAPALVDDALDATRLLDSLADLASPSPAPAPAPAPVVAPAPVEAASALPPSAPADAVAPEVGAAVLAVTAAAAVGWATGFWSLVGKRALGFLGVAGFTRLARDGLLDHEARDKLFALIRERPGVTMIDLVERSGAARNTVTYHLRVLEREGLVSSTREGRRRLYFPAGAARPDAAAFAAVAHATSRTIAERVRAEPGLDQRTLCASLALPPSLAHWHVDRLETAGVVTRVREGRHVRYYPGPAADRVLAG